MKKYYWVVISKYNITKNRIPVCEKAIDIHPFIEVYNMETILEAFVYQLDNWKEISEEEYLLWCSLNIRK